MCDETPLDLEGLKCWLQARLGQSIDVHIVTAQSTLGFVRGKIDQVMRFESDGSHGGDRRRWRRRLVFRARGGQLVSAHLDCDPRHSRLAPAADQPAAAPARGGTSLTTPQAIDMA